MWPNPKANKCTENGSGKAFAFALYGPDLPIPAAFGELGLACLGLIFVASLEPIPSGPARALMPVGTLTPLLPCLPGRQVARAIAAALPCPPLPNHLVPSTSRCDDGWSLRAALVLPLFTPHGRRPGKMVPRLDSRTRALEDAASAWRRLGPHRLDQAHSRTCRISSHSPHLPITRPTTPQQEPWRRSSLRTPPLRWRART